MIQVWILWWLCGIAGADTPAPLGPTIAIAPLASDQGHEALALAVTDYLAARLSEVRDLRLVERERIDAAWQELRLSALGLMDEGALRLGELVGADHLLLGALTWPTAQRLVLTARLVNVKTGAVEAAATVEGNLADVLPLTEQLAGKVAESRGQRLPTKPTPTAVENVSDYRLAWLNGLGAFWTQQWSRAIAWLTRARKLEPNRPRVAFFLARAYLEAGRKEHAAVELRRVVRDFPRSDEAKAAQALLAEACPEQSRRVAGGSDASQPSR